ncbi:transglutaminase family protein [Sphingobium sp. AN558]|uniref:transglutaminase-like domain-containing protein n=1 Tax=Sphingobium sp. AN558 TaxID=3133442 RepID=UPI0030C124F5
MLIRCGYDIRFETDEPTAMMALLSIHPSRHHDLQTPQRLMADPDVPLYQFEDGFGNVATRLTIPRGGVTLSCDFTIADSGELDRRAPAGPQMPVEDLPDAVMPFLLGSRYCETDRLMDVAWSNFGYISDARERVEAIVHFVHNHIEFGYHHARSDKTAWNAYQERRGVCRDFAHLAVTLCRCMNIPARYCTGYLGDIGIPPVDAPMDFSAWFDVYVAGDWFTYDARHNQPRIGRILMARGRDATDVALTTAFGRTTLARFDVHTDEVNQID